MSADAGEDRRRFFFYFFPSIFFFSQLGFSFHQQVLRKYWTGLRISS